VDVFAPRGEYQIIVEQLEPQGHGALQLAFEQLKRRLDAEGLFANARKRPLPVFPRRVGIVTSPRGAVIADILHILERRFPGLHIRLFPALVQGEGAADELVRGLKFFSQSAWAEVVILARGGGSLEDLWAFNEERVARAIADSAIPVISAVGHETDFTIADFVADLRAPTPSAAAELVICTRDEVLARVADETRRILQALRYRLALLLRRVEQQGVGRPEAILHRAINRRYQVVDDKVVRLGAVLRGAIADRHARRRTLEQRLRFFDVRPRLERDRNRLDRAQGAALRVIGLGLAAKRRRLENCVARLEQLSPLRVLERGYSIVKMKNGGILKDPAGVSPGAALEIRLAYGSFEAEAK
jgi:exodeoxyribonuclease VII large subunit